VAEPKLIQGTAVVTLDRAPRTDLVRMEIDDARQRLERAVSALKEDAHKLNVVAVVRESISRHPLRWLGGALAVGVVLGGLSQRFRYKGSP
jgi:hypothetical protein